MLCQLFFQGRLTDLRAIGRLQKPLANAKALNVEMQKFLRAWGERTSPVRSAPERLLKPFLIDARTVSRCQNVEGKKLSA